MKDIGENGVGISYRAHVRNLGWQPYAENGDQTGTTGKALCIEALQIKKMNLEYEGNIEYVLMFPILAGRTG